MNEQILTVDKITVTILSAEPAADAHAVDWSIFVEQYDENGSLITSGKKFLEANARYDVNDAIEPAVREVLGKGYTFDPRDLPQFEPDESEYEDELKKTLSVEEV